MEQLRHSELTTVSWSAQEHLIFFWNALWNVLSILPLTIEQSSRSPWPDLPFLGFLS